MKLPLWKAGVLIFFVGSLFVGVIEILFVSKIFSVMNNMITRFEQEEIQEQKDWDEDEKSYHTFRKEWHDDFEAIRKKLDEESKQRKIRAYCREIARSKSENRLLSEIKGEYFQKSVEPRIKVWWQQRLAELEGNTLVREATLKSDREMLNKLGVSENDCDESGK